MLDVLARRLLERPLCRVSGWLDRPWISANRITWLGLCLGLGSAISTAFQLWGIALLLWLLSRLADGLDGPLARRRRARAHSVTMNARGGFLDIAADVIVYGTTVIGVAYGASAGYDAPWWPFLLVLLSYYINGSTLLAFSSIAEKTGRQIDDGRSLSFVRGFAGATETIAVHSLWLLLPGSAWYIAIVWAAIVVIDAMQQIAFGYRVLN